MKKHISAGLIHSHEDLKTLKTCLASLHAELKKIAPTSYEIILVRSLVSKIRSEDLGPFENLVVLRSASNNIAVNRQLILDSTESDLLYFTDPDCTLTEGSLQKLYLHAMNYKQQAYFAFSGSNLLISKNLSLQKNLQVVQDSLILHGGLSQIERSDKIKSLTHAPTCHILYSVTDLRDCGGFNTRLHLTGEDFELNTRLSRKHKRIFHDPSSTVLHQQCEKKSNWFKKCFKYGMGHTSLIYLDKINFFNFRLLLLFFAVLGIILPKIFFMAFLFSLIIILVELCWQKKLKHFASFYIFLMSSVLAYLSGQIYGLFFPALQKNDG